MASPARKGGAAHERDAVKPSLSFEFFPCKTEAGHEKLIATARQLAGYGPEFFSCTYGAGGSTPDGT